MKKLLALLLLAASIAGCKKEDYSDGEFYSVTYQTTEDKMNIAITSTKDINPFNYTFGKPTEIKPIKKIRYIIELNERNYYKMDFFKLDGTVVPLQFTVSDKEMNLHF